VHNNYKTAQMENLLHKQIDFSSEVAQSLAGITRPEWETTNSITTTVLTAIFQLTL